MTWRNFTSDLSATISQPDKIVANEMRRDGQLWQNDNVYIMLDTYGDKRQCFFFRTNALGALSDTAVTDGGENLNGELGLYLGSRGQTTRKRVGQLK